MEKTIKTRVDRRKVSPISFSTAINNFKTYCHSRNLSPNTIDYYGYCLLSFTRYINKVYSEISPTTINPQVIREFLIDQTTNNSASTASHCHTTLKVFFGFLVNEGYIDSSPMNNVEKPKRRKTIIQTLSPEQVEAVLKTCESNFIGIRDRAMILVMFDCGLRVSELTGLRTEDILPDHSFKVIGKGNKERIVPFGVAVQSALNRYLNKRGEVKSDRVFVNCYGEPINRASVKNIITRKGEKAGITGVRCSPHTFRHTFAVQYLRNGGDVFSLQKLLGHSDLAMTRKYVELSQTDISDSHRRFSPADRLNIDQPRRKKIR